MWHTDRQTDTQTDRHTDRQTHRQTDTQTHRQTDKQTDRHTDRQTDTQTDRQTDAATRQSVLCVRTVFSFQFASDESFCPFICPDLSPCNCISSASYIIITVNSFRSLDLPLGGLMSESTGNNQWLYRWTCNSNIAIYQNL